MKVPAPRFTKILALAVALAAGFAAPARAQDADQHWGVSIWGLSYHTNHEVDFESANVGAGLRYYFNHLLFVEADALKNSNRGIAVATSVGLDLKFASLGDTCKLYVVAAGTVAYYQNERLKRDYFKAGPVPGVTLGCGWLKVNSIVVLQPKHQPFSSIVASLTLMFH